MKRILWVFAAGVVLAACNNAGTGPEEVKDSVLESKDSIENVTIDSVKQATDSVKEVVESSFDATDSANRARKTQPDRDTTNR